MSGPDAGLPGPPWQVRAAGAATAAEGLVGLGFAVALVPRAFESTAPAWAVLGEAGYFGLIGAALAAVGVGLVTGRRWARTPAIVTQLLLLPVVYSLIGPSQQLVLGVLAGMVVGTTFMLLINERSRTWWMGLPEPVERSGDDPPT